MSSFRAHTIGGSQRGKALGFPTVNLRVEEVPQEIDEGIYAGWVQCNEDDERLPAAIHYGPRLFHGNSVSFEIHVIDRVLPSLPATVTVELMERIRPVQNFPYEAALTAQITQDVARARAILIDA
ncbi:hypothetical protein COU80_00045 [Candidatus Peregrinibacteria bacterium CG10_big_fil_rev_8_21_14_0_10_55_24]|nr:MAG: hypothetical protein COU80_00045 [Candidatus Peregrinibacteria bacterium CG10_big_fil_rev_8_21_14_0_10_55_24]